MIKQMSTFILKQVTTLPPVLTVILKGHISFLLQRGMNLGALIQHMKDKQGRAYDHLVILNHQEQHQEG